MTVMQRSQRPSRVMALLVVLLAMALLAEGWVWEGPTAPADAAAFTTEWEEGPIVEGIPMGDDARRMRAPVTIGVPNDMGALRDLPVTVPIDIAEALRQGGWPTDSEGFPRGFVLDLHSVVLREVDADGRPKGDGRVPVQVFPGSLEGSDSFDPGNPKITLRWILDGENQGGDERHYFVYFDSKTRGSRIPADYSPEAFAPLATATGPGRGNQLYVALYDTPGAQNDREDRHVRIVNLVDGPNQVRIHEYTRFDHPRTTPAEVLSLNGLGAAGTYTFGSHGTERSHGRLLIESEGPVLADAYKQGPASIFIPSLDGGMTGSRFVHNPDPNTLGDLYLMCATQTCKGNLIQGSAQQEIKINTVMGDRPRTELDLQAGTPLELTLDEGRAAVQIVTGVRSPVAWPSMSPYGPLDRSMLMGYAEPNDGLMILSEPSGARLQLQLLGHGTPTLADRAIPQGHFQHRSVGENPLGASWNNVPWDDLEHNGIVRAQESTGVGGLHVISGTAGIGDDGRLGAVVTPESPNGGLSYTAALPGSGDRAFGELLVFALHPATTVTADIRTGSGTLRETLGPLSQHEVDTFNQPGYYEIKAERPVVVVWARHHPEFSMGGLGVGTTQIAEATVGPTQFTGPVFDIEPERAVITGRPGQLIDFRVTISNLGRTVDNEGIEDTARLQVEAPSGWRNVQVVPSTLPLDPDGSGTVTVQARIPSDADPLDGGASLRLSAVSEADPSYRAQTLLRVNYEIHREVVVTIDGRPVEAQKEVLFGEQATYIVEITNQGSLDDIFRLGVSNATGAWQSIFSQIEPAPESPKETTGQRPSETPKLEPGETVRYTLDVRMTAERASRLITQIQAVSMSDRSVRDTAFAITSFAADRSSRILVEDPVRLTPPGEREIYNITVINEADVNEEFRIETTSIIPEQWSQPRMEWVGVGDLDDERLNRTVRLDPHETIHLHVERQIPDDAQPGELALDRLRFQSTFRPAHEAGTDVVLRTTVDRLPGFTARFVPETLSGVPGEATEGILRLESESNDHQEITLIPVTPREAGWIYLDPEDTPPPWTIDLAADEAVEFPIQIQVPLTAPPYTQEPTSLTLHASTPGVGAPMVAKVALEIAERTAADIDPVPLFGNPGRWVDNPVPVTNQGNVPLTLQPRWDEADLPEGWRIEAEQVSLDVEERKRINLRIYVPAGTPDETRTIPIDWVAGTGRVLQTDEWGIQAGTPSLDARIEDVHAAGGSIVVPTWVINDGRVPVHNVDVRLMQGDTVLDRVAIHQILPGKEAVAPLVAPRDAQDLIVRVAADHNPEGFELDPAAVIQRFEQNLEEAVIPTVGFFAVLLPVAIAWTAARWNRRGCP